MSKSLKKGRALRFSVLNASPLGPICRFSSNGLAVQYSRTLSTRINCVRIPVFLSARRIYDDPNPIGHAREFSKTLATFPYRERAGRCLAFGRLGKVSMGANIHIEC